MLLRSEPHGGLASRRLRATGDDEDLEVSRPARQDADGLETLIPQPCLDLLWRCEAAAEGGDPERRTAPRRSSLALAPA